MTRVGASAARILELIGLLTFASMMSLSSYAPSQAQPPPFLEGRGFGYGWVLQIHRDEGRFQAGSTVWPIEYVGTYRPFGGYKHGLIFLGRLFQSFCLLFVEANDTGTEFWVGYYDFRENRLRHDRFAGNYDVQDLVNTEPTPSRMPGFNPSPIPRYTGPAFRIASPSATVTEEGGVVHTDSLHLQIYPLLYMPDTPSWQELWAYGTSQNPEDPAVYFMVFYSVRPDTWLLNLVSGQTQLLPLGRVRFLSE